MFFADAKPWILSKLLLCRRQDRPFRSDALIASFDSPMRCKPDFLSRCSARLHGELPIGHEWAYEIKLDGYRTLAATMGLYLSVPQGALLMGIYLAGIITTTSLALSELLWVVARAAGSNSAREPTQIRAKSNLFRPLLNCGGQAPLRRIIWLTEA